MHQLGALNAVETAGAGYAARGWRPWTGHTQAAGPAGGIDTYAAADRTTLMYIADQGQPLDADTALSCEWRPADLWYTRHHA
jgi:aminoglycoside 2'-N-acetyltransferase I